jgi:hypothetical protein
VDCSGTIDLCDVEMVVCGFRHIVNCCVTEGCGACCTAGSCKLASMHSCASGRYFGDMTYCPAHLVMDAGPPDAAGDGAPDAGEDTAREAMDEAPDTGGEAPDVMLLDGPVIDDDAGAT